MSAEDRFVFRRAAVEDIGEVRKMIQELADFEEMSKSPELSEEDLIRDSGLNGGTEYCHIYLLDLLGEGTEKTVPIAYAICYFSYSTWQGRSYFLEDIYVKPEYRKLGAGARVFREVAAKAKEYGAKRLDFHVLQWNPARKFYEKMGAVDLSETEEWRVYRVHAEQLSKLAEQLKR